MFILLYLILPLGIYFKEIKRNRQKINPSISIIVPFIITTTKKEYSKSPVIENWYRHKIKGNGAT